MDDKHNLSTILMLCSLLHSIAILPNVVAQGHGIAQGPEAVQEWFRNLPNAKEKLTQIHFYFHDIASGKNPTVVTVAESNFTAKSSTGFGIVNVMDDALTLGPEPNSTIVGRAQGIYSLTSLEEIGILMTLSFVFTDDKYNGSTLSVLGHNPILHKYREMPVVGGSGVFRLARGVATAQSVWINLTSGDAVVEYNLMVLHY